MWALRARTRLKGQGAFKIKQGTPLARGSQGQRTWSRGLGTEGPQNHIHI